jgi:hypothetical protein
MEVNLNNMTYETFHQIVASGDIFNAVFDAIYALGFSLILLLVLYRILSGVSLIMLLVLYRILSDP